MPSLFLAWASRVQGPHFENILGLCKWRVRRGWEWYTWPVGAWDQGNCKHYQGGNEAGSTPKPHFCPCGFREPLLPWSATLLLCHPSLEPADFAPESAQTESKKILSFFHLRIWYFVSETSNSHMAFVFIPLVSIWWICTLVFLFHYPAFTWAVLIFWTSRFIWCYLLKILYSPSMYIHSYRTVSFCLFTDVP